MQKGGGSSDKRRARSEKGDGRRENRKEKVRWKRNSIARERRRKTKEEGGERERAIWAIEKD